jgi:hypothetical protein
MTSNSVLLNNLTVIIPTYESTILELERAIEYWRDTTVIVHIIDSSAKPWFPSGALCGTSNIFYIHLPREPNQNPIAKLFENFILGSELAKTDFFAVGATDDFYLMSGLIESLGILNSNPKIDAVAGRVLTYSMNGEILWHHKYTPRKNWSALESESLQERLSTGNSWFLYAICRTEQLKKFLKICYEEKNFSKFCLDAHEAMFLILCKAMFRTKYINNAQIVRQENVIRADTGQLTDYNSGQQKSWAEFIKDGPDEALIEEIVLQVAKGFNEVTPSSEHGKNLDLARERISCAQAKAKKISSTTPSPKTIKNILGDFLFRYLPGLRFFADRPRRLKYLWRIPKYQYSPEQQKEVEEIQRLLLKPREELRLRANI